MSSYTRRPDTGRDTPLPLARAVADAPARVSEFRQAQGDCAEAMHALGVEGSFELGAALKYLLRAAHTHGAWQAADVRKARNFLNMWLAYHDGEGGEACPEEAV